MQPFTQDERRAIAEAIATAEARTSGEIVTVVAPASDSYHSFGLVYAALLALLVPLPLIYATKWPIEHIYLLQLAVFLVGVVLAQWHPLRHALVPRPVKRARAHQRALEQFLVQNLHTTKGRTGVLIYVSFAERLAQVIADEGIYRKVPQTVWEEAVGDLTHHLRRGERVNGFVAAIGRCGDVLAEHFPADGREDNELPNHLIELDIRHPGV